jgi:hypothetical protein
MIEAIEMDFISDDAPIVYEKEPPMQRRSSAAKSNEVRKKIEEKLAELQLARELEDFY